MRSLHQAMKICRTNQKVDDDQLMQLLQKGTGGVPRCQPCNSAETPTQFHVEIRQMGSIPTDQQAEACMVYDSSFIIVWQRDKMVAPLSGHW